MLVLILLTDIDPHLLQEESKTCPRDSRLKSYRQCGIFLMNNLVEREEIITFAPKLNIFKQLKQ